MSQYQFVNLESSETRALSVDRAARSHAIKTGLQHGSLIIGRQGAHQSRETIKHKTQLKGRFRLSVVTTRGLGSDAKKAKKQSHENQSSSSSEVRHNGKALLECVTHLELTECFLPLHQLAVLERYKPPAPILVSVQEISSREVDPFDSLPVTRNPQVELLLRYCTVALSHWLPFAN